MSLAAAVLACLPVTADLLALTIEMPTGRVHVQGPTDCWKTWREASRHGATGGRLRPRRGVNEAPEYADLRQVYLSRVAAEWHRQRSLTEHMSFTHLIDKAT